MTKSELKTGMIATTRDGREYMVIVSPAIQTYAGDNYMVETNGSGEWLNLSEYNEDLTEQMFNTFDIMKIEVPEKSNKILDFKSKRKTIWIRKKTYTYAQLKEILGTEFEVVG